MINPPKGRGRARCDDLAPHGDSIYLRDSKNPHVLLHYTAAEIDAFLDGAKKGEFDHLLGE